NPSHKRMTQRILHNRSTPTISELVPSEMPPISSQCVYGLSNPHIADQEHPNGSLQSRPANNPSPHLQGERTLHLKNRNYSASPTQIPFSNGCPTASRKSNSSDFPTADSSSPSPPLRYTDP